MRWVRRIERRLFVINDQLMRLQQDREVIDAELSALRMIDDDAQRDAVMGHDRLEATATRNDVLRFERALTVLVRRIERLGERRRSLVTLWEHVDADPARPWTRQMLADAAGMSGEHLRRLCQRETGRGPMQHLTALRMRRAGMLLESTDQKIGAIARAVGYENAFAFSTAFKRHHKVAPAAYRENRRKERRPRDAIRVRPGRGDAAAT